MGTGGAGSRKGRTRGRPFVGLTYRTQDPGDLVMPQCQMGSGWLTVRPTLS